MQRKKARILQIGTVDEQGVPQHWCFDCMEEVPFMIVTEEGILWAGYSVKELREIAETGILPDDKKGDGLSFEPYSDWIPERG